MTTVAVMYKNAALALGLAALADRNRENKHRRIMIQLAGEGEAEAVEAEGEDKWPNWRRNGCKYAPAVVRHVSTITVVQRQSTKHYTQNSAPRLRLVEATVYYT